MARKKKTPPAQTQPSGYYAEENVVWGQPDPSIPHFVASNLDDPDEAAVTKKTMPKGESRWFWRASDGALIEREFLNPGMVETQFTAQVKAIQWLNMRRRLQEKEPLHEINPETVQEVFNQAVAPLNVANHISTAPTPAEVVTATATAAPAADKPFSAYFPRHRDTFGNEIPDDTPHPDDDQPLSATVDPSLDDSKDEIIDPQPTRRGHRK